ncbi:MAG: DUF192 domain-containing protein [candidate division SR1 bacterium]|nr:DUF192 domain-containing protein [candidate division SR1 bacterium]
MKNKSKNRFWIFITIFIIFGTFYYSAMNYFHGNNGVPQVCVVKKCFAVELARTQAEQEKGLMYRPSMSENSGMLFMLPKSDIYNFWMKNTRIPLDMIRIDEQLRVVRIITAPACLADPCPAFKPEIGAKYVLEVNAGIAMKWGIVEGTIMRFKNIR